jgi:muramoyltetrapeptide carboxypeptidase
MRFWESDRGSQWGRFARMKLDMQKIYPTKLKKGDKVAIVAPSRSMAIISEETRQIADNRFEALGLDLKFGKHIEEIDDFDSSLIQSRVADLHEAFANKEVRAIITVLGGFNSNQLLDYLDWDLIGNNPKIMCGYSDITALNNAIFAKTGLVTYSGPHYSTFGQKLHFDYTLEYFIKCLMEERPFRIEASRQWSDDAWYKDQDNRNLMDNDGFWVINEGEARGTILGANLCTFNLLQGTQYMPKFEETVLFVEDDSESRAHHFDRDLQSLIHLPGFEKVRGLVIGRFQKESQVSSDLLSKLIKSKEALRRIPVVANVDFGHTDPKITFPVGGEVELAVSGSEVTLEIVRH